MDYLISEGYPRAAEKFAKEANIQLPLEEESIQSRVGFGVLSTLVTSMPPSTRSTI
jgi:hypothetical protein